MRLFRTFYNQVRWERFLLWISLANVCMMAFSFQVVVSQNAIAMTFVIIGIIICNLFFVSIVMGIFAKTIHGKESFIDIEYLIFWPLNWLFFSYTDAIVVSYESLDGAEMRVWCDVNCEGKWIQCRHGYFAFRKKSDLVAFKLRWL